MANLAVVMAQAGDRVILVDGDLRRPQQHEIFGLPNQQGLSDVAAERRRAAAADQPASMACRC